VAKQVVIVRHGTSASNAGLPTADPAKIALTEKGHFEAREAAIGVSARPTLLVSSPMTRAIQTAQYFRERFAETPFQIWPAAQEFVFMNLANQAATTPEYRRPMVSAYWSRCDPDELSPSPGCESFRSFLSRVVSFHHKAMECPGDLIVISHGFFMHTLTFLRRNQFSTCSSDVMAAIYESSLIAPYANGQAIYLAYE